MKTKLLYVDDEVLNLQLFQLNFRKKYDVVTAENGYEGLTVLENNPDIMIVISDMRMPGMNGIEFINKAKDKYPSKKFYILTGYEITEQISQALDSGLILKYFSKPFNIKEIDQTIQGVLD